MGGLDIFQRAIIKIGKTLNHARQFKNAHTKNFITLPNYFDLNNRDIIVLNKNVVIFYFWYFGIMTSPETGES